MECCLEGVLRRQTECGILIPQDISCSQLSMLFLPVAMQGELDKGIIYDTIRVCSMFLNTCYGLRPFRSGSLRVQTSNHREPTPATLLKLPCAKRAVSVAVMPYLLS